MKVELSIADDRELRDTIRDMIKGEVVSIARGEIRTIFAEVIKEGYIPKSKEELDKIIREEIRKIVSDSLTQNWTGSASYIKSVAREEVNLLLRELIKRDALT